MRRINCLWRAAARTASVAPVAPRPTAGTVDQHGAPPADGGARPWVRASLNRGPVLASLSLVCLVMAVALYRFSDALADPDIWGHLRMGEFFWQTGRVLQPEPFSYVTDGIVLPNHEWLIETILYLLFTAAGTPGLTVLKAAVGLLLVGVLYWHLWRQGLSPLRAGIIVVAVVYFLVSFLTVIRPHISTYVLFLATLLLIDDMARGQGRWWWAAPPLFALWANLHGGFLAGLGILVIWSTVELAWRWLGRRSEARESGLPVRVIVAMIAASVLAVGLTPHGFHMLWFVYQTATVPRPEITEWQPLVLATPYGLAYCIFVAGGVASWLWSRRERRPAVLAVVLCCMVLPLIARRHVPLAVFAVAVLAAEHIGDAWDRWSPARGAKPTSTRGSKRALLMALVCFAGTVVVLVQSVPSFSCIRIDPVRAIAFPVRAIGLIKRSGVSANLAVEFNWGMYAINQLSPKVKVSVDGRREAVYEPRVYQQSMDFRSGQGEWDALLREHDTHLALVPRGSPADNLMRLKRGWVLLYEDPLAALFGREGLPWLPDIRNTEPPPVPHDGDGLCLS
jgi:hypothetical protein